MPIKLKFSTKTIFIKQYSFEFVIRKAIYIAMKVLNIHKNIALNELLQLLQQKFNRLFKEQRQTEIIFNFDIIAGAVEISQPELYEGFLYRIEIKGTELWITRSEHYVDDVNSLTVESILNGLFEELAADGNITFVLEG